MNWFSRRREEDLQEEIRSHLSMAAQDRVAEGLEPEAARRAALKEFGNVTLTREDAKLTWGNRWVEWFLSVWSDLRYAVRLLVRNPGFALIVVSVLALGIGANTVVFSLFKSLALRPLPRVEASAELGVVAARTSGGEIVPLSYHDYLYVRDHDSTFTGLMGSSMRPFSLGLGARGERVWGELVTGNYFQVLGVGARLGRTLLPSDAETPGQQPVVVISDGLWRRTFGSDPNIVGKTILVNAYPLTIVGVTPPGFQGSVVSLVMELFVPVTMQPRLQPSDLLGRKEVPLLMVFGRLKPGTRLPSAAAQVEILSKGLAAYNPARELEFNQRAVLLPMWRSPYGAQTYMLPAILLLSVMGALLLLIVCANVANLVLVRGVSRRGEIGARLALGAGRGRILRLLFIENLLLAGLGAIGGIAVARVLGPLISSASAGRAPMQTYLDVSTDVLVVAFIFLIAGASAVLFGFVPALGSSRVDLASVMKDDLSPRSASKGRLRAGLVVSQVAVSLLLLVGAGLVRRSLEAARHADVGFDARNVASVSIDVQPNGYDESRGRLFYEQFLDSMRAEPGIESASLAASVPLTLVDGAKRSVQIEGYVARRDEDLMFLYNLVSPDYFRTLRISLLAGRDFARGDDLSAPKVAIVNETMARRYWGMAASALGKRVRFAEGEWRTIIGVARDVKYARVTEDPRPHVYLPFLQVYSSAMMLQVRSAGSSPRLVRQVNDRVQALDPNLPILDAQLLADQVQVALSVFESAAGILLMIGVIATALAALGIYGLVSYNVKQCTHEIGIRMAIGAQPRDIVKRFLTRGFLLAFVGTSCGLVGALAVTRMLRSLLYGVSATDLVSFGAAAAVVLAVALVASWIPSWRAARTDPIAALRHQ
jgi:macrolide transport system ATP-binding/permease protein